MTHMQRTIARIVAALVVACPISGHGVQEPNESLKRVARSQGGKTIVTLDANLPLASLAEVVASAELIVEGVIVRAEPSLTADERMVLTRFAVQPSRVWKDIAGARLSPRPGPTQEVVFVEAGGTVRTEGLEIVCVNSAGADPPLKASDRVIALLRRDSSIGAYRLQYGPFGLLRVVNGQVVAASKEVARRRPLETTNAERIRVVLEQLVAASGKSKH